MLTGALAALTAALCWTLASSIWRRLPTSLNALQLNLLKNALAVLLLCPLTLAGSWQVSTSAMLLLMLSGVLGIALGDSLYFAALRRLGTRRTLTLDAGGPALTALAGMAWLAEVPEPLHWLGLALITAALLLVALQQQDPRHILVRRQQQHGVLLALAALLCGSAGALLSRAALRDQALDPFQSAWIRLLAASVLLAPLSLSVWPRPNGPKPQQQRWPIALLATLLGTTAGLALQQMALQRLPGGMAVTLLATAPVMAMPLAAREGDRPGWPGWLAAGLALIGVSLVVA